MKRLLPLALLAASAAFAAESPLPIELPRPLFVGTPKPIEVPNLEPLSRERRPPFLAPEGAVNLALNRPVTSSDPYPIIGELELVTDGDKAGTDGTFVELGPGTHWVQIDLGASAELHAILVWHFHAAARVYHDVVVQVSDDPEFQSGVTTLFNNDGDNSSGLGTGRDRAYVDTFEGRLIPARGVRARYIRTSIAGNTSDEMNHFVEVEAWGLPPR